MSTPGKIIVTILNFNGKKHLERLLPSVLDQTCRDFEVVVVDNCSTEDDVAWLKANFYTVKVVIAPSNEGYSALNRVFDLSEARDAAFFIFLTNDLILDRRVLEHGRKVLAEDKSIGLLGFEMLGAMKWVEPSDLTAASARLGVPVATETKLFGGAAMMFRREIYELLGGIDPVYFCYCDEDDFQTRAKAAGYRIAVLNTPIWHNAGNNTLATSSRWAAYLQCRNDIRFRLVNFGLLRATACAIKGALIACAPFVKIDRGSPYEVRRRPFSPVRNAGIVLEAWWWNAVHFCETLRIRGEVRRRIRQARAYRAQGTAS
jgi:GT2 family glycosyltransferase